MGGRRGEDALSPGPLCVWSPVALVPWWWWGTWSSAERAFHPSLPCNHSLSLHLSEEGCEANNSSAVCSVSSGRILLGSPPHPQADLGPGQHGASYPKRSPFPWGSFSGHRALHFPCSVSHSMKNSGKPRIDSTWCHLIGGPPHRSLESSVMRCAWRRRTGNGTQDTGTSGGKRGEKKEICSSSFRPGWPKLI